MASPNSLSEYATARSAVEEKTFWSEMSIFTGLVVAGLVLVAGMIVEDINIMKASVYVALAFCFVSSGILLSMRKHNRILNRHACS